MTKEDLIGLPGGDLVAKGLRDLEQGVSSVESLLVLIGAPRLTELGVAVPKQAGGKPPHHQLYDMLTVTEGSGAHSRYNALIRKLVSCERAIEAVRR